MCITYEIPKVEAEQLLQGLKRYLKEGFVRLDASRYPVQLSGTLSFPESEARDLAWVDGCRKPHLLLSYELRYGRITGIYITLPAA
jgi:hypothetical protein